MLKTYILLFYEFFKTGLFTFGGGYGSLPFLYHICDKYQWFSHFELTQLIALSGLTPGPIGLNMATFAGFKTLGFQGAIISSLALILPMLIVTIQVFRLYQNFCSNRYVKKILYFLKPASCALISGVGVKLFYNLILNNSFSLDYRGLILFIILMITTKFASRNPVIYMLIGAIGGILVFFFNIPNFC